MPNQITWPLEPADPRNFTGTAFMRLVGAANHEEAVKLYYVRFMPGARTNWHVHSGNQILVVTAGTCQYQRAGEPVRELTTGESVRFLPGERHWHGAAPTLQGEHIAINLDIAETTWLEPVSESDLD
jgi:4-carboxymuconolactone decarboxylase